MTARARHSPPADRTVTAWGQFHMQSVLRAVDVPQQATLPRPSPTVKSVPILANALHCV